MRNKQNGRSFGGKGYYIALILCAAAIGISGYMYYRNVNNNQNDPDNTVSATVDPANADVPAVATQPQSGKQDLSGPQSTTPNPGKALKTVNPVEGETVASYAMDCLSYNATTRDWRVHNGMDIAAAAGTQVRAAADGTVYTTYEDETMGVTVVIRHEGGYVTKYSSLDKNLLVAPGDTVKAGDVIGCVGITALLESAIGDHVHFCVLLNDEHMDPAAFLAMGK